MTQRIFNMDNKQDVKDLFDLLPDWVNWITKDKNSIKIFQDKPYFNKYNIWQTDKNENDIIKHIDIDFQPIAYTRCIIQRPINYQDWIGKWGIFANQEENLDIKLGNIGCLEHYGDIDDNGIYIEGTVECSMFYCRNRNEDGEEGIYDFFRPLTPEEKQQIIEN